MLIYLASPYSHPNAFIREQRFDEACRAAGKIMKLGHVVFSPIAHSHPIAERGIEGSWDFWQKQDLPILERCDALAVLELDGWKESVGVQAEIAHAEKIGKTIGRLDPATIAFDLQFIDKGHHARKVIGGDAQYLKLLDELRALHLKKAADYGSDEDPLANIRNAAQAGVDPALAAWVRTLDKVQRINQYWKKRTLANESVEDSYLDLAAYALIGLRLLREKDHAKEKRE